MMGIVVVLVMYSAVATLLWLESRAEAIDWRRRSDDQDVEVKELRAVIEAMNRESD